MKNLPFHWPDITTTSSDEQLPPLGKRLLWMATIWTVSITLLCGVALLLRWVLKT
ncbi:DUF2474 family protein [Rhodoferax sp.]|uniref:DUF2474 family protein n=1 Tax=Rhodoferax sp. TaxID=50421 RepID=UPI003A102C3F